MTRLWVLCVIPLLALGCVLTAEPPSLLENPPQTGLASSDFHALVASSPVPTPQKPIFVTVKQSNVYFRTCASRQCDGTALAGGTVLEYRHGDCVYNGGIVWIPLFWGTEYGWMSEDWIQSDKEICE